MSWPRMARRMVYKRRRYIRMDNRRVEVKRNDEWTEVELKDINPGEMFRLYESTGESVIGNKNDTEFKATTAPYLNNSGEYVIGIE